MEANPNESRKKNARKNPLDENLGSINEEEVKEEVKEEEEEGKSISVNRVDRCKWAINRRSNGCCKLRRGRSKVRGQGGRPPNRPKQKASGS